MEEEWKSVKGFENSYEVSNKGRVRSIDRVRIENNCYGRKSYRCDKGKVLKQTDNGNGYLIVGLRSGGKRKNKYIHRLVAEAFCSKKEETNVVNHKDRNTKNNVSENLEWVTAKRNIELAAEYMRHPKKGTTSKTGEKYISKLDRKKGPVYRVQIRDNGRKTKEKTFKTLEEAIRYRNEVIRCGE